MNVEDKQNNDGECVQLREEHASLREDVYNTQKENAVVKRWRKTLEILEAKEAQP